MEGLQSPKNLDGCVCFIRQIEDLEDHLDHSEDRVWRYIDISDNIIDIDAKNSLSALKDSITKRMPNSLIFE